MTGRPLHKLTVEPVARPQPRYRQLADLLEQRISSGEFIAGQRLPSESVLMGAHGMSRTTVRAAVAELRHRGRVGSRQGFGTVVLPAVSLGSGPDCPAGSPADLAANAEAAPRSPEGALTSDGQGTVSHADVLQRVAEAFADLLDAAADAAAEGVPRLRALAGDIRRAVTAVRCGG